MKKLTATVFLALGLLSTATYADSWAYDGKSKTGGERCQCTWSFDK